MTNKHFEPNALAGCVTVKPTNPKDAIGIKKVPYSTLSGPVLAEAALGMMEGALKYGRHNYRAIGVRASVYYDATRRHLDQWWEGEDWDPESKAALHHVTKAITSLIVLRDAMINNKFTDDRPPRSPQNWMEIMNAKAAALLQHFPNPVPAYTHEPLTESKPSTDIGEGI